MELILEEKKQEEKILIEQNNNIKEKKENPLDLVNQEELNKVSKLDENIYYDKDLNPFTLRLYYLNTERALEQTAYFIKNSLKEL